MEKSETVKYSSFYNIVDKIRVANTLVFIVVCMLPFISIPIIKFFYKEQKYKVPVMGEIEQIEINVAKK